MKGETPRGAERPQTCDICGHSRPWHRLDCPKAAGKYCPECQMRWPRHYPDCLQDVLEIGRWWIGREGQRMLEEMFTVELEARGGNVVPDRPPEPTWFVGQDRPIRPVDGQRILRSIMEMMRLPKGDKVAMEHHRKEIHEEIERLAGGVARKEEVK